MSAYDVIHPVQYQIQRTALKFHPRGRILMVYQDAIQNPLWKKP